MAGDAHWLKATRQKAAKDRQRLERLLAEREELDTAIRRLAEKVHSWEVILASVEGQPRRGQKSGAAALAAAEMRGAPAAAPTPSGVMRVPPSGLRDAIRQVLSESNTSLRPKEVTRLLLAKGYQGGGKSDLSLRVNGELWRMAKNGLLRKGKNGYLPLKQEGEQAGG